MMLASPACFKPNLYFRRQNFFPEYFLSNSDASDKCLMRFSYWLLDENLTALVTINLFDLASAPSPISDTGTPVVPWMLRNVAQFMHFFCSLNSVLGLLGDDATCDCSIRMHGHYNNPASPVRNTAFKMINVGTWFLYFALWTGGQLQNQHGH